MSVLVKNIEFPQKCSECDFRNKIDGYWYCGASYFKEIGNILPYGKADFCPLVEVKTPHGRLVDVDKLSENMYHDSFEIDSDMQKWDSGCWIRYKMFENNVAKAETIIGAESD